MNIQVFLQVLTFLASNREVLKQIVLSIQTLLPDATGSEKASAVKDFIATTMGIESQIEGVWLAVSPFFNRFVASVKGAVQKT